MVEFAAETAAASGLVDENGAYFSLKKYGYHTTWPAYLFKRPCKRLKREAGSERHWKDVLYEYLQKEGESKGA